ncbi:MAG: hypothetical protein N3F05_04495 [Candidatus Diapherotrites archaeon]|nr:hypothetical protein [Candidatus Diapherotrites archaeon]
MEIKVSAGPWSDLLVGEIEGFSYEVKANSMNTILSIIHEKEGESTKAVLLEVFHVLHAKGDVTSFLKHLPKRTITLSISSSNISHQFVLVDSGVEYIPYDEIRISQKLDELVKRTETLKELILKVSSAYDVTLTELNNCDNETKSAFYSMPLINLIFAPIAKRGHSAEIIEVTHGEIHLGITKANTTVKEPFDFFERTVVFGGQESDRLHVLHVLAESAMLSDLPLIIVDWTDSFRGLNNPNKRFDELAKYKVELDPVGFPIKVFRSGLEINAQIEYVDPEALIELFGLGKNTISQVLVETFKRGGFKTIEELKRRIADIEETPKITPFVKRGAQRIIEVIECIYPGLFVNYTPVEDITKKWARGISRANILLFKSNDFRKDILSLQATTAALKTYFKSKGESSKLRWIVFFTASNMTIPRFSANYTSKRIAADLVEMAKYGCGLIVEASDKVDINSDVAKLFLSTIGIISGNDAAVVIENRKNYRALIRPGISDCCKKEN